MDNYKQSFLAFFICFFCFNVYAGYAQLTPPSSYSSVSIASQYSVGSIGTVANAANNSSFRGGVRAANDAVMRVSNGVSAAIPIAYKYAPLASKVAAAAAFANPYVFAAATIGSIGYELYNYYKSQDLVVEDNQWKKVVESDVCLTDCYEYSFSDTNVWVKSLNSVIPLIYQRQNSISPAFKYDRCFLNDAVGMFFTCSIYWWDSNGNKWDFGYTTNQISAVKRSIPPYKNVTKSPATLPDLEVATAPVFDNPPFYIGDFPIPLNLPVEKPIINPTAPPASDPYAVPTPQPMTVPVGEPQLVPNSNPEVWKTPAVRIVPSPTEAEPWRVDVQPVDVSSPSPTSVIDPVTGAPKADTSLAPKESPTPGLCDLYPDILACAKPVLDIPENGEIQKKDIAISISPQSGWGADSATCPASRHLSVANVDLPFTTICSFMLGIRPVIIALAWLSAGLILLGFRSGGD